MNNVLYSKIVPLRAYDKPAGTVVGACVTQETNGYAVWRIEAEGDGEAYRHELQSFLTYGRESALEEAVSIIAKLKGENDGR